MIDPDIWGKTSSESISERTVRQFAALCVIGLAIISVQSIRSDAIIRAAVSGAVAILLLIGTLLKLRVIRLLFVASTAVTKPIGVAVSRLLLSLVYYFVFTPLGLLFRLFHRDVLLRRRPGQAQTYWVARKQDRDFRRYFNQA